MSAKVVMAGFEIEVLRVLLPELELETEDRSEAKKVDHTSRSIFGQVKVLHFPLFANLKLDSRCKNFRLKVQPRANKTSTITADASLERVTTPAQVPREDSGVWEQAHAGTGLEASLIWRAALWNRCQNKTTILAGTCHLGRHLSSWQAPRDNCLLGQVPGSWKCEKMGHEVG
ncbi:hypothetical protein Ddc_15713 [Ditylenchus destructor]|nr:hypothetical protein Ddc_15713 [Ditylenchus destructor]